MLPDDEFLRAFFGLTLPNSEFRHRDHLRLAWLAVRSHGAAAAEDVVTAGIRIIDGERIVTVNVSSYFADGIETAEQLDAALDGVREECTRLIGAGKKIIIQ